MFATTINNIHVKAPYRCAQRELLNAGNDLCTTRTGTFSAIRIIIMDISTTTNRHFP